MSKEMAIEQKRYVTSGRHEKRKHNPIYALCPNCKESMFSLRADTTKDHQHISYPVAMKYCPACKLIKILSKEIKIAT